MELVVKHVTLWRNLKEQKMFEYYCDTDFYLKHYLDKKRKNKEMI